MQKASSSCEKKKMKHPFKTVALIIFAAVIVYQAWPKHTVKDHNPATGEGIAHEEGHTEHHLQAELPTAQDAEEVLSEAGERGE